MQNLVGEASPVPLGNLDGTLLWSVTDGVAAGVGSAEEGDEEVSLISGLDVESVVADLPCRGHIVDGPAASSIIDCEPNHVRTTAVIGDMRHIVEECHTSEGSVQLYALLDPTATLVARHLQLVIGAEPVGVGDDSVTR